MHDGAFFESKGIPSVALVSDAFKPQARAVKMHPGPPIPAHVLEDAVLKLNQLRWAVLPPDLPYLLFRKNALPSCADVRLYR